MSRALGLFEVADARLKTSDLFSHITEVPDDELVRLELRRVNGALGSRVVLSEPRDEVIDLVKLVGHSAEHTADVIRSRGVA